RRFRAVPAIPTVSDPEQRRLHRAARTDPCRAGVADVAPGPHALATPQLKGLQQRPTAAVSPPSECFSRRGSRSGGVATTSSEPFFAAAGRASAKNPTNLNQAFSLILGSTRLEL